MSKTIICLKCKDEITSYSVNDFKYCKCGNIFVDGGDDYVRLGGYGLEDGSYKWKEDENSDN